MLRESRFSDEHIRTSRSLGSCSITREGDEAPGLIYDGKRISGGQQATLALTFDQFRQDQNVYLHHDEYKDAKELKISDGLSTNARPDWTAAKEEYQIYDRLQKMPPS
jgi:hypothetical protein